MNNKIEKIICILIGVSLIIGIYFILNVPMDSKIKNKTWYNYDIKTGNYNKLYINKNIELNISNNNSKCNKYHYNSRNKKIILDCGIEINILKYTDNYLNVKIDKKEMDFYTDAQTSLNNEFQKYYELTISEYSEKNKQAKEIIKTDYNKLEEILNDKGHKNIIILMGNECVNIECTLILNVIEKMMTQNENIYYIDVSDENKNKQILNKLDNLDSFNMEYPLLYKVENGNITKEIFDVAKEILDEMYLDVGIRLIGLRLDGLKTNVTYQTSLFENVKERSHDEKIDSLIDEIQNKYGVNTIQKGVKSDSKIEFK